MKQQVKIRAVVLTVACCAACLSLGSCKGAAGKRAVKEIETVIGREAKQAEEKAAQKAAEKAAQKEADAEAGRNARRAAKINHPWVECSRCGGQGWLYVVDDYGNIQYNYYGNPSTTSCPYCYGSGYVRN